MKKKTNRVAKFKREADEREFWSTHDTTDHFDFSKQNRIEIEFDPAVEAPVKSISLRLPREMLNELKVLANKKDIRILRHGKSGMQTLRFNYKEALEDSHEPLQLIAGDTVIVK